MMSTVYSVLREDYDFIVVDTPPAFSSEVIATVDVAEWICMVAMFDALSLKNTRRTSTPSSLMGHPADHLRVVLNSRRDERGHLPRHGRRGSRSWVAGLDVLVPSDREIPVSINDGVPITLSGSRSDAARAINSLADMFALAPLETTGAESTPKRRRRRLFRRKPVAEPANLIHGQIQEQ